MSIFFRNFGMYGTQLNFLFYSPLSISIVTQVKMSLQDQSFLVGFGNSHVAQEIASPATTCVTAFLSATTTVTSHQKIAQVRKIEQNNHFLSNTWMNLPLKENCITTRYGN